MWPTMILAALVASAVPGMDKEATAQEASELLRGHWRLVHNEENGNAARMLWQVQWECDGRKFTVRAEGGVVIGGTLRIVPNGHSYVFSCWLGPDKVVTTGRAEFRGTEFHLVGEGKSSVWRRQLIPNNP